MQRLAAMTSLVLAAAVVACSDPTGPEGEGTVVVQLATLGSGATNAPSLAVSVTRGENVIVIQEVQLVARKLRLEQDDAECDDEAEEAELEEGCGSVRLGPVLLDPPLEEGADPEFTVDLPAGSYDRLHLQIHKPSNATGDAAFIAANPAFDGVSIRVTGTWNGTPFEFTTDLTQVLDVELEDPLVVEADGETAVTLLLDVGSWFLGTGGTTLINPSGLSQQNRSLIEQNIRQSFHAFEDEDGDGDDE